MLKSFILNKEFVNYRKYTEEYKRNKFSNKIRSKGTGFIPIVVDSVDPILGGALSENSKIFRYGLEIDIHMDSTVDDLLIFVNEYLKQRNHSFNNLVLGLENGSFPNKKMILGNLYKEYRNKNDKILYFLLTRENTIVGYLLSIIDFFKRALIKN